MFLIIVSWLCWALAPRDEFCTLVSFGLDLKHNTYYMTIINLHCIQRYWMCTLRICLIWCDSVEWIGEWLLKSVCRLHYVALKWEVICKWSCKQRVLPANYNIISHWNFRVNVVSLDIVLLDFNVCVLSI